jgi:hypothetical protein
VTPQAALRARSFALFAPLSIAAVLVAACPKGKGGEGDVDAAPSSSSSNEATNASVSAWSPAPSTSFEDDASIASGDDPLDVDEEGDATIGDADAGDASDADAKKRVDASDDAPLMGTKTYPDEEPQSGFRYVTSDAAKVHKAPKDGKAFVSLQRGSQVWLLGRYYDWYRIKFEDPSLGVVRQGWIFFTNVIGPKMKTCPESWIHHDDNGGWCERECTKNTDCKALPGWKCSGTGCFYAVQP